jgi:hypothetical protein
VLISPAAAARSINAGGWGFIYLVEGCFLAVRAPRWAAFVWGLGTCNQDHVSPFHRALLVGLVVAESIGGT